MKYITYAQSQGILFPHYIEDWVEDGHLCKIISIVVDNLDISSIDNEYQEEGRPAYHPRMMLKVLFYAYAEGERASRRIEERLRRDVTYMYLSGRQFPDHRTISDFRKRHIDKLSKLFVQIVLLCKELGLVKLGNIVIDGVRIKGNAAKRRTRSKEELKKEIDRIEDEIKNIMRETEEIDRLEDEEEKKKKEKKISLELKENGEILAKLKKAKETLEELNLDVVNLTDPTATFQKTEYGLQPGYNGEIAVDKENLIIVAEDVTNESYDTEQLVPILEQVKENTHKTPEKVLADGGFYCGENLKYLKDEKIDGYIPSSRKENEEAKTSSTSGHPYCKEKFVYDNEKDVYVCPEGNELKCVNIQKEVGNYEIEKEVKIYRGTECNFCDKQKLCINPSNKSGNRSIQRDEYEELRTEMEKKMNTSKGKEIYKERAPTVEGVFGYIKEFLGYRRFLLRALKKVKGEFTLICIAWNITRIWQIRGEKIIRRWKGLVENIIYFLSEYFTIFFKKCNFMRFLLVN